jgi:hypothetical protein
VDVRPFAARPEHAGRVRVVAHHPRAVPLGDLHDFGDRADVTGHREDAFGVDDAAARQAFVLFEKPLEIGGVVVLEASRAVRHQPRAVDQTRVVLAVEVQDVAASAQRRNRRGGREEAGAEDQRGLLSEEVRQFGLKGLVELESAGQEPRSRT